MCSGGRKRLLSQSSYIQWLGRSSHCHGQKSAPARKVWKNRRGILKLCTLCQLRKGGTHQGLWIGWMGFVYWASNEFPIAHTHHICSFIVVTNTHEAGSMNKHCTNVVNTEVSQARGSLYERQIKMSTGFKPVLAITIGERVHHELASICPWGWHNFKT